MEDKGIERKDETIEPCYLFLEGDDCSEERVEEDDDQENDRTRDEHERREEEVGLEEVPLLSYLEGEQV